MTTLGVLVSVAIFGWCFFLIQKKSENKIIHYLLIGAFGIRLLFLVFNIIGFRFPLSDTSDIFGFFEVAKAGADSSLFFDFSQSYIWASILGIIYNLTGDIVLIPLMLNVVLGTFSVMLAYKMVLLFSNRLVSAYVVLFLVGFSPPLIFGSASHLRESITTFFVTATFYLATSISKRQSFNINQSALLLGSAVISTVFHGGFVFLVVMAGLVLAQKIWMEKNVTAPFLALMLLLGSIFMIINFQIGGSKVGWLLSFDLSVISNRLESVVSGGISSELQWLYDANSLLFTLVSSLRFIWAPLFAENLRYFDLARIPYIFIITMALVMIIFRCVRVRGASLVLRSSHFIFLMTIFVTIFGFSIFSLDNDTAFRHLSKLFPVIIALGYFYSCSKPTHNCSIVLSRKQNL